MSSSSSDDLAAHLRFFAELGVAGVSRDPVWRTRRNGRPDQVPALAEAEASALQEQEIDMERGLRETNVERGLQPARTDVERGLQEIDVERGLQPARTDATEAAAPPAARLLAIREDIGACTRCKLHTLGRRQIVFGVGHAGADLMFVGEAPGADEDVQGIPFVGRAGQLLTKIIESIGLTRDDVYIANVIKCRPPQNRNPEPDEVATCQPFLFAQIEAVKPRVIVALGAFAAQTLLSTTEPISRLRGRACRYRDTVLIPTFHPAYLLRNPSSKRAVWEDMKQVRAILQGERSGASDEARAERSEPGCGAEPRLMKE